MPLPKPKKKKNKEKERRSTSQFFPIKEKSWGKTLLENEQEGQHISE